MKSVLVFFLGTLVNFVAAAELSQTYQRGPVPLSPVSELSWSVDFPSSEISMALKVTDSALNTDGDAWVGIGVGEDTSGGMLGADIFTAEFAPGSLDNCTVKDRHVPFVAYPLTEGAQPFPVEDSCQKDKSWSIVSCKRDLEKGVVILEVKRPLAATTEQDRAIASGEQVMMYAYGGSAFTYHAKNRGSSRVTLFNDDDTLPPVAPKPLPTDIVQNFTYLNTNYKVPSNRTTYSCTTAKIPLAANEKRYMVAAEHVLNSVSGGNLVHHFIVHACPTNNLTELYKETDTCSFEQGLDPRVGCSTIFAWAVGIGRFILPDDVGLLIDESNNNIIVESHFDNPEGATDVVDNSGVRLYFSRERKIEAGLITLGDFAVSLMGQTVKNEFNYTSTCPSNCTAQWPDEKINVFSSFLHMHTTGKQIWTNRYNSDGTFNSTMNSIGFWSNDHQLTKVFDPPLEVRRGDILSTTCNYDTTKAPDTKFGLETLDEMCMDFVFYYPVQKWETSQSASSNCGMFHLANANYTASFCGASSDPRSFNFESNPSFDDTTGIAEPFGNEPATCALAEAGNSTEKKNDTAVCFPGSALVQTRTRGIIQMAQLRINDEVSVGIGMYSPVYMFTHRITSGSFEFVELETQSGEGLRLSAGHHIYSNGQLVRADSVRVGDVLVGDNDAKLIVSRVADVTDTGLYNPQTLHGNVAVNGIVTSTYTEAILPNVAHAMLSPLRSVKQLLDISLNILESDNMRIVRHARRCLST